MKALTICQPYAHLIALPDDDPRAKRVENRGWHMYHRGDLAIHAGKGKGYLELDDSGTRDEKYGIPIGEMAFGAVVAVACVLHAFPLLGPHGEEGYIGGRLTERVRHNWPWLADHAHVEGPRCILLTEVRRLPEPVPCKGRQGLWDVTPDVERQVRLQLAAGAVVLSGYRSASRRTGQMDQGGVTPMSEARCDIQDPGDLA